MTQPYLTNYLTSLTAANPATGANYNALLNSVAREQTYGFWSTEQAVSNADIGHYQTISGTINKSFNDIDVKWLTAYRWFDNRGTSISRGLPYDTADYEYMDPGLQVGAVGTDGERQRAEQTPCNGPPGRSFFGETSLNDGGLFYLYLPSAVTPQAVSGKQITEQDGTNNSQRNTSYAGYAQATWSVWSDTRITGGRALFL